MEKLHDILQKTLTAMPPKFTSNEFMKAALRNGLSATDRYNGSVGMYLKTNCEQGESRRAWYKKTSTTHAGIDAAVSSAIALLKSRGYKVIGWTEL